MTFDDEDDYRFISISEAVQDVLAGLACTLAGDNVICLETWKRAHARPNSRNSLDTARQASASANRPASQ